MVTSPFSERYGFVRLKYHSCSALTLNWSAALLAASQEALLGVHSFLITSSIPAPRTQVELSVRRAAVPRGSVTPHSEFSVEALTAMYAALTGGVESLMGLTLRHAPVDAPGPRGISVALIADQRRDAAMAANNLRDDMMRQREGQAVWADSLPGALAFATAVQWTPYRFPPPMSRASLHLITAVGSYTGYPWPPHRCGHSRRHPMCLPCHVLPDASRTCLRRAISQQRRGRCIVSFPYRPTAWPGTARRCSCGHFRPCR